MKNRNTLNTPREHLNLTPTRQSTFKPHPTYKPYLEMDKSKYYRVSFDLSWNRKLAFINVTVVQNGLTA